MKNTFKILAAALALVVVSHAEADNTLPAKDVVVAINDVFVPGGFDSSTDAYVVVSGLFPNGCYKWKGAEVNNVGDYTHNITTIASVSQGMCIQVLVPFTKDVKLGRLASGTHSLRFLSNDGTYMERKLEVE